MHRVGYRCTPLPQVRSRRLCSASVTGMTVPCHAPYGSEKVKTDGSGLADGARLAAIFGSYAEGTLCQKWSTMSSR